MFTVQFSFGHSSEEPGERKAAPMDRSCYELTFCYRQLHDRSLFHPGLLRERLRDTEGKTISPLLNVQAHLVTSLGVYNEDTPARQRTQDRNAAKRGSCFMMPAGAVPTT
jgi:hypothetical protein